MSGSKMKLMNSRLWRYLVLVSLFFHSVSFAANGNFRPENRIEFNLNGLQFTVDKNSGSIVRLAFERRAPFLETSSERASILDLAYPCHEFEPLRLASKFSDNAHIETSDQNVTISWNELGASRSLSLSGNVLASVRFEAAADGRSVILSCTIKNNSPLSIRQVFFPDLAGLLPVAGEQHTRMRSALFSVKPFELLKPDEEMVPFYATGKFHVGNGWIEYKSGRYKRFSERLLDWLDFGSLTNGFSLFAERWPPEDSTVSMMLLFFGN